MILLMKHVIEWVRTNGPVNSTLSLDYGAAAIEDETCPWVGSNCLADNNNTKSRDYYNTNSSLDIFFLGRRTLRQDNIENVLENEDNQKAIYIIGEREGAGVIHVIRDLPNIFNVNCDLHFLHKRFCGDAGDRTRDLSHAKRTLYR